MADPTMSDAGATPVLVRVENGVGRLTLNRPEALNALTIEMIQAVAEALRRWRDQPLRAVIIDSASPRAFCAGGDIRAVRQNTLDGCPQRSEAFFAAEYTMNRMLASYVHPVLAVIDGVCMGGGLGLSVHGPYRVVTERAVLAMPETAIGFFPDIGASYFLPRLPGAFGMYLGLTGARVTGAEAVRCGLATHLVTHADVEPLIGGIVAGADLVESLSRVARPAGPEGPSASAAAEIDHVFSAGSVADIRTRLASSHSDWARETAAVLDRMSPRSLEVTHDLISRGRDRTLDECLHAEFVAACVITRSHDFIEGVRAVLVDKDHSPAWE